MVGNTKKVSDGINKANKGRISIIRTMKKKRVHPTFWKRWCNPKYTKTNLQKELELNAEGITKHQHLSLRRTVSLILLCRCKI